jgi:hypothetical protein
LTTRSKGKAKGIGAGDERLAHRGCNTKKGAIEAVVPWPDHLFVVDPAPIIASVERLQRRAAARSWPAARPGPTATRLPPWLVDRIGRLRPDMAVTAEVEPGGGQFPSSSA